MNYEKTILEARAALLRRIREPGWCPTCGRPKELVIFLDGAILRAAACCEACHKSILLDEEPLGEL